MTGETKEARVESAAPIRPMVVKVSTEPACVWAAGPLRVWCKSSGDELWVGFFHLEGDEKHAVSDHPPEEIEWSRWAVGRPQQEVRIIPLFPDRPVVVKPENPFRVAKGARAKIYVRVPLWLRLELTTREALSLIEIPTVVLSNTWFGTYTEGELCYWISSGARRQIEPDPTRSYLAICPIQISNRSDGELQVEKLCLRVGGLSLFSYKGQLWSDETVVAYRGGVEPSQVEATGRPPAEAPEAELVTRPRNPVRKRLSVRTFASFRELPGLGLLTT